LSFFGKNLYFLRCLLACYRLSADKHGGIIPEIGSKVKQKGPKRPFLGYRPGVLGTKRLFWYFFQKNIKKLLTEELVGTIITTDLLATSMLATALLAS